MKIKYIRKDYALANVQWAIENHSPVDEAIENTVEEEVAPIFYAKWETDEVTGEKYCSDCLEPAVFTSGHFYHCGEFCSHCGAKMIF